MGEISVKTGNNARNGGKNSLNRLIRCVCGEKIEPWEEMTCLFAPSLDACVSMLGKILKKMSNKNGISQTEESEFAFLLTNYIKQTLTFREWQRNADGNQRLHFLINIYGAKEDGGEVVLRPFIVNPDELMLTPADVVEFNSQVINVDRQRHPEWFR
ncbi:hypothetical protein [Enterobacter hormaechei]|uniref:hypothetical protein n=1 Tax=Enterobacter hormaechei TaxID=158836 RepID=UPI001F61F229|nr:hypothetical protein [Enterobacter hormaechei]